MVTLLTVPIFILLLYLRCRHNNVVDGGMTAWPVWPSGMIVTHENSGWIFITVQQEKYLTVVPHN